jgi:hypothetical protein
VQGTFPYGKPLIAAQSGVWLMRKLATDRNGQSPRWDKDTPNSQALTILASEVINGKRSISKNQAKALIERFLRFTINFL